MTPDVTDEETPGSRSSKRRRLAWSTSQAAERPGPSFLPVKREDDDGNDESNVVSARGRRGRGRGRTTNATDDDAPVPDAVSSSSSAAAAAAATTTTTTTRTLPRRSTRVVPDAPSSNSSVRIGRDNRIGAAQKEEPEEEAEEEKEEDDDDDDDTPTSQQISAALRKLDPLEDDAADSAASREASIQALSSLYDWADVATATFFTTFHSLGGIRRVLDFLQVSAEAHDLECVYKAASVLSECSFFDETLAGSEIGACIRDMVKMLVQVKGVETLIDALPDDHDDDTAGPAASAAMRSEATLYIWTTLRNITYLDVARGLMRTEQKMRILNVASDCLGWLANTHTDESHHKILDFVLTTLSNLLGTPDGLASRQYKANGMLTKCLKVLKRYNMKWMDYEDLAQSTVVFFGCYLNYREGDEYDAPFDRTLFMSSDYHDIIIICVECLKYFRSNATILDWAAWMLKKTFMVVGTAKMERLGVVEVAGTILKAHASSKAKSEARKLMEIFYNKK